MKIAYSATPAAVQGNGHISVDWNAMPEWITVHEAADIGDFHPEYVRRLARAGKIGAEKKGRDWWIDRDVFRAYLDEVNELGAQKFTRLDFREDDEVRT